MNLLLDECVPRKLKRSLSVAGHVCSTVPEAGFAGKANGELLTLAQQSFDVFVTLDTGLEFQQNLAERKIAILVIRCKSNRLADILPQIPDCLVALRSIKQGDLFQAGAKR
jgi:predicted nuclease of predicted toxin-antitoxin system